MLADAVIAHPPQTLPPFWDAERDETLVCRAVRAETHDVKTFVFSAPEPRLFSYQPGQFLTFEFQVDGATFSRCYTIASPPTRPHLISITVKRVAGGPVSGWLHAQMRPGMEIKALGPMGEFTCSGATARKLLFLSGGSGITPLMSMARAHQDLASDADIAFVHAARTPADIIFRQELSLMARERPGFRPVFVCETDAPDERWSGFMGRLSPPMLSLIAPDLLEREIYACGPSPYMAALRTMLTQAGFDMARYHEESFNFAELTRKQPEIEQAIATLEAQRFGVEFNRSRRSIDCGADSFVLDAARAAGLRLPSSCTRGMCGTCKSKLVSGTVTMTHAGGIRQREIDQGMILICCSKPTSDLVIER